MSKYLILSFLFLSVNITKGQNQNHASVENIEKHIKTLIFDDEIRNYENTQELNRVADYIKSEMESIGLSCKFQVFDAPVPDQNKTNSYKNIVCTLPADKPQSFIVGAHYDVAGVQEGADDNASGVAGLIESARILYANKASLKHNLIFVAYTLEEPPYFRTNFMGSYVHAKSLSAGERENIAGMISLETIGYYSEENIQEFPIPEMAELYPKHGNFIAAVSNLESKWLSDQFQASMLQINQLDAQVVAGPAQIPGIDFSDHKNYWTVGIDAIMITDTAFNRNKNYHKATDVIETLDFEKIGFVVNGLVQMLIESD